MQVTPEWERRANPGDRSRVLQLPFACGSTGVGDRRPRHAAGSALARWPCSSLWAAGMKRRREALRRCAAGAWKPQHFMISRETKGVWLTDAGPIARDAGPSGSLGTRAVYREKLSSNCRSPAVYTWQALWRRARTTSISIRTCKMPSGCVIAIVLRGISRACCAFRH